MIGYYQYLTLKVNHNIFKSDQKETVLVPIRFLILIIEEDILILYLEKESSIDTLPQQGTENLSRKLGVLKQKQFVHDLFRIHTMEEDTLILCRKKELNIGIPP